MKSIAQNDVRSDGVNVFGEHAFDRAVRPHRHERRGGNIAMSQMNRTTSGTSVGVCFVEGEFHECLKYENKTLNYNIFMRVCGEILAVLAMKGKEKVAQITLWTTFWQ